MPQDAIHRFEIEGRRYAIDPETCFCFECDEISWDVLEHYPAVPVNRIFKLLADKHSQRELSEVLGELEWLRATRSILRQRKMEDFSKEFQLTRGLRQMTVRLPRVLSAEAPKRSWFRARPARDVNVAYSTLRGAADTALALGRDAVSLLFARSLEQKELRLEFIEEDAVHSIEVLAELCRHALKAAALTGKTFVVAVHVTNRRLSGAPAALDGHDIGVKLEFTEPDRLETLLKSFTSTDPDSLAKIAKALNPGEKDVAGRIVVTPGHARFGGVVETLDKAGFKGIEIDLDGAYLAHPELDHAEMVRALRENAVYYANRLLKGHYFRVDPIAPLFYRIYDGAPMPRTDLIGTHELAVDCDGGIFPSPRLLGKENFRLGSLNDGTIDEDRLRKFEDVGAITTVACRRCWARNMCGGGCAAVHQVLSGSYRLPSEAWCEAQRDWYAAAVSAFNVLSSRGVNFTRVYNALTPSSKPSLFTMMRMALRMTVTMRPIEEADAAMLVRWENWNPASYFLFTESGTLMATRYDREMDSIHPQRMDQEMILMRRDRKPFGLLRLKPDQNVKGAAWAWLYFRNDADYAADDVRKGLRNLLHEASKQQSIRRLVVPAAAYEEPLQRFLEAVGFTREGTQREALYLHGDYHDVHLYGLVAGEN